MSAPAVFDPQTRQRLEQAGVVAVLVIDRVEDAVPLARALLTGGVTAMELTLRTPVALQALREIRTHVPEMLAGVGTVLTPEQVQQTVAANAAFAVAPGVNRRIIQLAHEAGLSFAPGIVTPSDIEQAIEAGCRLLKFFPAEPSGGLAYLQSMAAPYAHLDLQYVPLGGVNVQNMRTYLQNPLIAAVGGSWLAGRDLIRAQNWHTIARNAEEAREIVCQVRGG